MYHPVLFTKELLDTPKAVRLQQKNLVVWKTSKGIHCVPDRCPHRAAKLSSGRMVGTKLECPYHGWLFDTQGQCVKIPQLEKGKDIPRACHLPYYSVKEKDGVLWIAEIPNVPEEVRNIDTSALDFAFTRTKDFLISDYSIEAPYNYFLQIENLLDPAHLHFVHDGFQGNRTKACTITVKNFYETDTKIYGYFEHQNEDTPDIEICFYKPSVVDVSIRDKKTKKTLRKNVIYVSPIHNTSCNVLFRDIALKHTLIPQRDPFLKFHGEWLLTSSFVETQYQAINARVIDSIMEQDIGILKDQQENIGCYIDEKYTMPAECDRLIIAFRKWCKNNMIAI